MSRLNPENLPVIYREIASVIVFSCDGCILMGRKDLKGGGVYSDSWHLPGGGVETGETLMAAAQRELNEEVIGLDVAGKLEAAPFLRGSGATTKTQKDGSKVWCEMNFNYFRLVSNDYAQQLAGVLHPGSDFVELRFFSPQELAKLPTVPGGVEDRIVAGALTSTSVLSLASDHHI